MILNYIFVKKNILFYLRIKKVYDMQLKKNNLFVFYIKIFVYLYHQNN